jgi:hypothetical protein
VVEGEGGGSKRMKKKEYIHTLEEKVVRRVGGLVDGRAVGGGGGGWMVDGWVGGWVAGWQSRHRPGEKQRSR